MEAYQNCQDGAYRLLLEIKNPPLEEVWLSGYECAQEEIDECHNPYPRDCREHEYWREGWYAAMFGETPLLDLGILQTNDEESIKNTNSKWVLFAQCTLAFLAGFALYAAYDYIS